MFYLFIKIYLFIYAPFLTQYKERFRFPFNTVCLSGFLSASSTPSERILLGDKLTVKRGDVAV